MILLFNSSNLRMRLPLREGFLKFWTTNQEQSNPAFAQEMREIERFSMQLMRNQRNSTRTGQLLNKGSKCRGITSVFSVRFIFCVSNSWSTVISERFSSHPDRKLRFSLDYFWSRQKTSINWVSAIKISWHPHHPIYPLRWWVSEWDSTRIERERLLVLCFGQGQIEMQ